MSQFDKGQGCFCGCGAACNGHFAPGHDAKLKSAIKESHPQVHVAGLKGVELLAAAIKYGYGPTRRKASTKLRRVS